MGCGGTQEPFKHMLWAVAFPIEHDGPAPQVVAGDLFVALQTATPVEQSVAPVWH